MVKLKKISSVFFFSHTVGAIVVGEVCRTNLICNFCMTIELKPDSQEYKSLMGTSPDILKKNVLNL